MAQDPKKLKASLDLAQLQHQSYGTAQTLEAYESAKEAYEDTLEAELAEADLVFDEEDEDEQHDAAEIEKARKLLAKVDGKKIKPITGTRRQPATLATTPIVAPNHATAAPGKTAAQVEVINSTGNLANTEGGAEQGAISDATKAAQDLAAEKKASSSRSRQTGSNRE